MLPPPPQVYRFQLPVPLNVTGGFVTAGAATFTVKVALLAPAEVGLNLTVIVQGGAPTAKVPGQALVRLNWPGFAPPRGTLLMTSGAAPVLVTVTV